MKWTCSSRTTLNRLEAGVSFRRSTAISILKSLLKSARCTPARGKILEILTAENINDDYRVGMNEILNRMDDLIIDISMIESWGKKYPKLLELLEDLNFAVKKVQTRSIL